VSKRYLETIKAVDGVVFNLEYHQARMESVLASLGLDKFYTLKNLLTPPKSGLYRCRVLYDVKDISVEYLPYTKREVKSLKLIYNDEIEYSQKEENRDLLNELFSLKGSCDDILIVKGGLIRDTSIANIAFFDGNHWLTPKQPLLKGTMRQKYLDSGKIVERNIFVNDIKSYTKVALMNAMIDFDIIAQENIEEIIC